MSGTLPILLSIFTVLLAAVLSYVITKLKFEKKNSGLEERLRGIEQDKVERDGIVKGLQEELTTSRNTQESLRLELARKESELTHQQSKLEEQQGEVEKLQEKFTKDFEILANKILEDKSTKFTAKNKENIEQILSPLQEKIKSFEKKVEDTHKESLERQSALRQQILGLKDLNTQITKNINYFYPPPSKKQSPTFLAKNHENEALYEIYSLYNEYFPNLKPRNIRANMAFITAATNFWKDDREFLERVNLYFERLGNRKNELG